MTIKKHIKASPGLENFKVRGDGSSRLEALSDGVFALAIAILLLSSSVPKNFEELWLFVLDIVPFGICMIFIYWIWRQQVTYFLRYGLVDAKSSILNMMLLFFVLIYVYPLKFLMSWLIKYFTAIFSGNFESGLQEFQAMIPFQKIPVLMIIYGLGFVCIFVIMYLLYKHALNQKEVLELSPLEEYETRFTLNDKLSQSLVGLISISLATSSVIFHFAWGAILAGWIYNLIWVISIFQVKKRSKDLKTMFAEQMAH